MTFRRNTKREWSEDSLYEYAVGALGRRMRTVAELKRLMRTRLGDQPNGDAMMEAVVARLKEHRYLNDTHFATVYSSYRKDNEKFGRMRVVQDLKSKGVHPTVIDKAVGAVYEGVDEQKQAREFLRRKRVKAPEDQKHVARIFRMLARAGFSTRATVSILRHWNVDEETVSMLEEERAETEDHEGDED
jgi:regulatory protein